MLMIKIPIYCCDTFVLPLLKLYYLNQVFLLSWLCTDTILHLNLLLKHLHEVERVDRSWGMIAMVVKLLLLLMFLKLLMLPPPVDRYYLSLIDRKVAVLFLKILLHNVYSTLIIQVLFLVDQYLMVHWWQDLLLLWC